MINLKLSKSKAFIELNDYVSRMKNIISATAAATYIIHNDRIVNEWYSGVHDNSEDSRLVDKESQFNVASVRKTFWGLLLVLHYLKAKSEA